MPPELIPLDEEYASSEDEDFAPDAVPAPGESSESEAEDEDSTAIVNKSKKKTTKRKRDGNEEAEDAGFENSGDEAIIEKGLKRRKKKGRKGGRDEEDEGGEGGLVKTRSMRAQEKVEKKPLADTTAATVDVDALWATMISGNPLNPTAEPKSTPNITNTSTSPKTGSKSPELHTGSRERSSFNEGPDSMVMIKRTYNFAGKVITEQKLVPKDSAEAKLFLASQESTASKGDTGKETELFVNPKRGLKKARRSIFEPVIENLSPQRTDLYFGTAAAARMNGVGVGMGKEAKKLNTVEKSAMDWAGFVDKEGYKDELDAAGKKKGAYGERQAFLARVEAKKVEDERRARGLPV
ncbi:swr complex subunit [Ciborinia camelliae]|nr:swr complex subunit [Ciborinia camelliae]